MPSSVPTARRAALGLRVARLLAGGLLAGGLVVGGLLVPAAAWGAEPEIRSLRVDREDRRVLLSFRLTSVFDAELLARIESGLPTGFVYEFELLRDRQRWLDRPLQDAELQVIAMYDAVNREYLINYKLDGELIESRMIRDLEQVQRAMTRFEDLPVFTLEPLEGRWRLLVKVRARLGLETLFSIIPVEVSTEWATSKKFRPPESLMPPPE